MYPACRQRIESLEIRNVHISVAYRNGSRSDSRSRVSDLDGVADRSGSRRTVDKGVADRLGLAAQSKSCACILDRLNGRAVPLQRNRDRQVDSS